MLLGKTSAKYPSDCHHRFNLAMPTMKAGMLLKMTSCRAQPSVQTNNTQILAAASAEMRQNVRLAGLQG